MARLETLLGLLQLVASSGGELDSRIRLQKEAYLIAIAGDRFRRSSFEYHHYGPYSRELSDALREAVNSGLLDELKHEPDDGSYVRYSYRITEDGKEYLAEAKSDPLGLVPFVQKLGSMPWRALELAATVKYLELDEDLNDREYAFRRSIELKPQTANYRVQATQVLESLGI